MRSIEEINKELEEVYKKFRNILEERDNSLANTFIDKYYLIDNDVTKTYFYYNDFFIEDDYIKLQGEIFRIYNNTLESYSVKWNNKL